MREKNVLNPSITFVGIVSRYLRKEILGQPSPPKYWVIAMNKAALARYENLWLVTGHAESDYIRRHRRHGFRDAWELFKNNLPADDENAWDYRLRLETLLENDLLACELLSRDEQLYWRQGKKMFPVVAWEPLWQLARGKGITIDRL